MATATTPKAFLAMLDELPELKTFPAAASRLMAEFNNPNLTPKRIAEMVSCDPAMAGHLMHVANSPLYGYCGQIRTIEHAVVVLGMRSIHQMILTMAGSAVFSDGKTAMRERKTLWKHSLAVATTARVIADYWDVAPGEAFLAGVFHDVGKLVIFDLASDAYVELNSRPLDSNERLEWEQSHLGIDHAALGMDCADSWGLPGDIAEAIGQHHHAERDMAPLCGCTYAANLLTDQWDILGDAQESEPPAEEEYEALAEQLRDVGGEIKAHDLPDLRERAASELQELLKAFA